MNEPINRVHRQEESNSTIGTIAKHVGINLAISGALEGGSILGAKKVKHQGARELFHGMAYSEGVEGNRFVKAMTAGMATKPGRIVNYGTAIATGLLTGALASNKE